MRCQTATASCPVYQTGTGLSNWREWGPFNCWSDRLALQWLRLVWSIVHTGRAGRLSGERIGGEGLVDGIRWGGAELLDKSTDKVDVGPGDLAQEHEQK